ncbi:MAG: hypothetical protein H7281_16955 [Bacteriovorax sp.]|nr:hypothetical protein [Bacteriovorax sp.]
MIIEINHQPQFKLNKNNFIIISLILTTSILSSCVKPYGRHSSTSNPISINIAGGASLILDANTLTGTTSPGGSCSVSRWNDSSGAGNTGTINCATGGGFAGSGIPSDPFRIVFNGLSTSVTTFLNAQPNTMASSTWVAWIKPASTTFQEILSIDGHTGAFNRTVMIDNATQDFGVFNPFNSIFTTKPVDLGAWQFIAVTFAPSDIVFTKNGIL